MGISAIAAVGVIGGMAMASSMSKPAAPQIQAPPQSQAAQTPDAVGTRASLAGAAQGGGSPGVAQTFLTGASGVDPSMLQLGKNTLLGGGVGTNGGNSATGG